MSSKSTHVKDINVTIPVEQLQYKQGDEDHRQFFPDEYGFISTKPPPHFPTAMNVDFGETTRRQELSYDNLQTNFREMNISRDLPREGQPARRTDPSQEQRQVAIEVQRIMSEMTQIPGHPPPASANVASSQDQHLPTPTVRPTSPSQVIERHMTDNQGEMSQQLTLRQA